MTVFSTWGVIECILTPYQSTKESEGIKQAEVDPIIYWIVEENSIFVEIVSENNKDE